MVDTLRPSAVGRLMMRQQAARWWWAPLIAAVLWFVIAWLVLRADYTSLTTVGVIVGVAFLVVAANEALLASIMRGGWVVWHIALSVLFVLGAIWSFARPVNTFFALASVLGLLLLLEGIFTIMRGAAMRDESPYWWLDVVVGSLVTLLGIWVSTSDGTWNLNARASFILLWVGFMAIFRGVSDITLAFSLRHYAYGQDAALPAPQPAVPPRVPQPTS
jgi:uncharacterized membrane protein HdeD (DUF308 family)